MGIIRGVIGTLEAAADRILTPIQQRLIPELGSIIGAITPKGDTSMAHYGRNAADTILNALSNRSAQLRSYPRADRVHMPNPAYFGHIKPYFADGRGQEDQDAGIQDMIARRNLEINLRDPDTSYNPFTEALKRYEQGAQWGPVNPFQGPDTRQGALTVPLTTPASDYQRLEPLRQQAAPPGAIYGPAGHAYDGNVPPPNRTTNRTTKALLQPIPRVGVEQAEPPQVWNEAGQPRQKKVRRAKKYV